MLLVTCFLRMSTLVKSGTYLLHNISQLLLNLLLRALEPLPQIVAHAASLQKNLECLLRVSDLHNAVDVLCCAAQERSFQDAVWYFGVFLVQQRQVDVALEVLWEPGLKGRGGGCFTLAIQGREDCEGSEQNEEVGDGN